MTNTVNILQITTHDSGRHFGCYGHPTVRTPAIDQLAAEGVLCSNYFCTVPICSASRASQLTGLYPQTHGLLDLVGFGWRLNDGVKHASQVLKSAGYRTMLYGVQHEVPAGGLDRLAFDVARPTPNHAADSVIDFLRRDAKSPQPFYAQIGFFETHTPFDRGGIEPDMEQGVAVPPYLADDEGSRQALDAVSGLKVTFDNGNAGTGEDPAASFIACAEHVVHAHFKDWTIVDAPIFIEEGIVHYCVANMPGAVSLSSTLALTSTTLPYGLALADLGLEEAVRRSPPLARGVNIYQGEITCPGVATALGCACSDLTALLA